MAWPWRPSQRVRLCYYNVDMCTYPYIMGTYICRTPHRTTLFTRHVRRAFETCNFWFWRLFILYVYLRAQTVAMMWFVLCSVAEVIIKLCERKHLCRKNHIHCFLARDVGCCWIYKFVSPADVRTGRFEKFNTSSPLAYITLHDALMHHFWTIEPHPNASTIPLTNAECTA